MHDTIFALATSPGRAALSVIRVSGPAAGALVQTLCRHPAPVPRRAVLRSMFDRSGEVVDQGLVLWFPGPNSYTGEDVFELQVHGGLAVVESLLEVLSQSGARLAEPGEFTRRAFETGRLELSQAEAIADLIDAETTSQRRQALAQLNGAHAKRSDRWRSNLLESLALLESQIDFADEEIPDDVGRRGRLLLDRLLAELTEALADTRGEQIRGGLRIALVGEPNAGKSSLLNLLVGRDAAIVTPIAGTTRDVIEIDLDLRGFKAVLADTAGIRGASDPIEREGVRRALAWAEAADLRVFVVDGLNGDGSADSLPLRPTATDMVILTRGDLYGASTRYLDRLAGPGSPHWTSIHWPESITALRDRLGEWAVATGSGSEFPAVTRARHRVVLAEAREHLIRGLQRATQSVELLAEDVRLAARAIERLTGRISSEEVLDQVFGSFCIGK